MKTALKIAAGLSAVSALTGLASTAYAQQSAAATATGSATIVQAISISATANLGFGAIVKPTTGTSTIIVSNTGNNRSISGGDAVGVNANGVTSAAFLIKGEGGSAISITVPSTFNMLAGTNTLTVTTTSNTTGTGNLSNSLGTQGSFTVGVGGSFPLTNTTPSGSYSGNLIVSANYN